MGDGAQIISWLEGFCEELVRLGLQPIRFDRRDTGLSTHMENAPPPDLAAAIPGSEQVIFDGLGHGFPNNSGKILRN